MKQKKRVKRRTFSGCVCEQEVFTVAANRRDLSKAEPIERFKSEYERAQHREGISRRHHARLVNANFTPDSLYTTLTLDNDNECHTFYEARELGDLYIRRLKYACPDARIMLYMGRGKKTSRIHFHMLSDGIGGDVIEDKWGHGEIVDQRNLRAHNYYNGVDHGQDYTGLANYLFGHWTPEHGTSRRWRATKNIRQPEPEKPTVAILEYSESKPPRAPKGYKLVEHRSNKFGYQYFKYVKEPDDQPRRMRR